MGFIRAASPQAAEKRMTANQRRLIFVAIIVILLLVGALVYFVP